MLIMLIIIIKINYLFDYQLTEATEKNFRRTWTKVQSFKKLTNQNTSQRLVVVSFWDHIFFIFS